MAINFAPARCARPEALAAQKALNVFTREALDHAAKVGRPKSGKEIVTLRLDPDVIKALKADGAGWQPRANALLRKVLGLK